MMRGMFLRKLKDFAEQLKNQKMPLLDRFARAGIYEDETQDELDRSEFIEKI